MILNHSKTIRSVISLLCISIIHFLLFYYDLISCTTPACCSAFYQCAMVPILVENYLVYLFVNFFCKSRHTVVCRVAQEAGVPPVSILTGRKKTQFLHLCSSVIPSPIGTKFAREVPASMGSLHTKFEENAPAISEIRVNKISF